MNAFVTGAAGFIGSNLVDRLLKDGHTVVGFDNFSTGKSSFLLNALEYPTFKIIEGDLLTHSISDAMSGCDTVFHLAANADVRYGLDHPRKDLEQNTIATSNVLESMRESGIKKILFSSTGSVYGESTVIPTPEDAPFPIQTSLYGASKLACEGLIEAYCEGYDFTGYIFRFVGILGERYNHGHVINFYKDLAKDPTRLHLLGDGTQRKSYLYVQDCIDAILTALDKSNDKINIFNLGTDEYCTLNQGTEYITNYLGVNPIISYQGGDKGWVGDNPFIYLDCSKIRSLGWKPKLSIKDGIIKTLEYLEKNQWLVI